MAKSGPVFQIGFNKCGTTALNKLFHHSGYRALHGTGWYWKDRNHPALHRRKAQVVIHRNLRAGRPAVESLEDFDAFFDMEFPRGPQQVENFRHFAAMARDYPDARFILNTRDKADWLRSRARHNDGVYLENACKATNLDAGAVLQMWAADFDRHHDAVRMFFAAEQDRLLDFDIDKTPIRKLVKFFKPDFVLYPRFWKKTRVTDLVAKSRDWADIPVDTPVVTGISGGAD